MKGHWIRYSDDELEWLEWRQAWPRATLHSAFVERFGRGEVTLDHIKALCARKGWNTGRTGCFEPGIVPANKGKRCPEGVGGRHPNARKTQFKKGQQSGRAKALHKAIGTERWTKDGYLERKIHDGMPIQSRWRAVHLIEWEKVHGPIPKAHCLKSLDGTKTNLDPANWELIHRAVLLRLNGGPKGRHLAYDQAAPEVRPVLLTLAKVAHRSRKVEQHRPGAP